MLVDITKDVTAASCEYTPKEPESVERAGHYTQEDLDAALEVISKAKKPYIYLGGGAILSGASEEVRAFAKKLDSPVCDTLMGKGAYDGYDPLYTGMIGMHGTKTSNLGVSECDLWLHWARDFLTMSSATHPYLQRMQRSCISILMLLRSIKISMRTCPLSEI